jgi:Carboxypeptidase regulatory-like domain
MVPRVLCCFFLLCAFVFADTPELENLFQKISTKNHLELRLPPEYQQKLLCQPEDISDDEKQLTKAPCKSVVGSIKETKDTKQPTPPNAPANDLCADAIPVGDGTFVSETCSATKDGSTSCQANSLAPDIWYVYTPSVDQTVAVNTFGSGYDTMLSVHSGCPGTNANQITCSDDCGSPDSCLSFNTIGGNSYWIRIGGYQKDSGKTVLNVSAAGSFGGRITDSATNSGVPDAQVFVYTKDAEFIKAVTADSNGNYVVNGLATGSYIARTFNAAGYIDEVFDNVICEGVTCTPDGATLIAVTGGKLTPISFALDLGGDIRGNVTDVDTGNPLEGIEVHIHDLANRHISIDFTDANGQYDTFDGLPAGPYVVLALNQDGFVDELYDDIPCVKTLCSFAFATIINSIPGVVVDNINFGLKTGGRIKGTVTDSATQQPISGVQIAIFDSVGNRVSTGSSDSTGNYTCFDGLPTGSYFVRTLNFKHYIDELHDNIVCTAGVCNETSGTPVLLTVGSQTSVDFKLDTGAMISGRISEKNSGDPLLGSLIDLYDASGNHLNYEVPDNNGNYSTLVGLPSGNYFLKTINQQGFVDQLYKEISCVASRCNPLTGTPVFVQPGNNAQNIDFPLEKGAAIGGHIIESATGFPLSDIFVLMFDSSFNLSSFGFTNGCGEYESFHGMISDTYIVSTLNDQGFIDEAYDNVLCLNGCDYSKATPISLLSGQHANNVNFDLSMLMLRDEFQDNVLSWNVKSGDWIEQGGFLTGSPAANSNKAVVFAPLPWIPSSANGCSRCTIETSLNTFGGTGSKVVIGGWHQNSANRVELSLREDVDRWKLKQIANGKLVAKARKTLAINPGTNYRIKIRYNGAQFEVWVNDQSLMKMSAPVIPFGNAGFAVKKTSASFDNVLIY